MPNHVKNIINMKGIKNLPLFSIDKDGKKYFDFNKIIPMPESLNIESGTITEQAIVYFITERCTIPIECLSIEKKAVLKKLVTNIFNDNWIEEMFRGTMVNAYNMDETEKDDLYKKGYTYLDNYIKYGTTTWYDWSIINWGTKWNAYSFEFVDDNTIKFETAWNCPEPVIKKLSEMYPELTIKHWWADEDIAHNTGHGIFVNNKMYDTYGNEVFKYDDLYYEAETNEAYKNYELCWGESQCLYKDESGNYHHKDCENCSGCN